MAATKAQLETITNMLKEQNEKIATLTTMFETLNKPDAKPKTDKKVKAGAGGASSDEEKKPSKLKKKADKMSDVQKMEHKIALSEKYIADETKSEDVRKKRAKQLDTERKELAKLLGDTADEKKDDVPIQRTYNELKKLQDENKISPGTKRGEYWLAEDGVTVTGLPADSDEEFSEIEFKGKKYDVGDNTKRLYKQYEGASTTFEREDYFLGYPGIAEFSEMKINFEDDE